MISCYCVTKKKKRCKKHHIWTKNTIMLPEKKYNKQLKFSSYYYYQFHLINFPVGIKLLCHWAVFMYYHLRLVKTRLSPLNVGISKQYFCLYIQINLFWQQFCNDVASTRVWVSNLLCVLYLQSHWRWR